MNDRKRLIALATSIALVISVFSLITLAPASAANEVVTHSPTTTGYYDTGENVTVMEIKINSTYINTTFDNITITNEGTLSDIPQENVDLLLFNNSDKLNASTPVNATSRSGNTYSWSGLGLNATYNSSTNKNFTLRINITAPAARGTWKTSISELQYYNTSNSSDSKTLTGEDLGVTFATQVINPLEVTPNTVIYDTQDQDLTGTILEDNGQTFSYTVYTPEGNQNTSGTTNDGEFLATIDFTHNDSVGTKYEANYTVYIKKGTTAPTSSSFDDAFNVSQVLDFVWNQEGDQPLTYNQTIDFTGKLVDAQGDPISGYNVTLLRNDTTVHYGTTGGEGKFGWSNIINDHTSWELGVTNKTTAYFYKYFDVTTEPLDDLNVDVSVPNKVAYLQNITVNVTIDNEGSDTYGLVNVTGINWRNGTWELPGETVQSGDIVVDYANDSDGDAQWLLINDSNDDGIVTFNATANSTGYVSVDAKYENTQISTPDGSAWTTPSEVAANWTAPYDRIGSDSAADLIHEPNDINRLDYLVNAYSGVAKNTTFSEEGHIKVVPLNGSGDIRYSEGEYFVGTDTQPLTTYNISFELKDNKGALFPTGQTDGNLSKIEITGPIKNERTITYEPGNDSTSSLLQFNVTPIESGNLTIKATIEGVGTYTITEEVDGLTISQFEGTQDGYIYVGEDLSLSVILKHNDAYVNNGKVVVWQDNATTNDERDPGEIRGIFDARVSNTNNGEYNFKIDSQNITMGADKDSDGILEKNELLDLRFNAYQYIDADEDTSLEINETNLAVQRTLNVLGREDLNVEMEPQTLTAGVKQNLTLTVTRNGEPVNLSITPFDSANLSDSDVAKLIEINGKQVAGNYSYNFNTSAGEYTIVDANFSTTWENSSKTIDVNITTADRKHYTNTEITVEDPSIRWKIVNSEGTELDLMTAGISRKYNVTVYVEDAQGQVINTTNYPTVKFNMTKWEDFNSNTTVETTELNWSFITPSSRTPGEEGNYTVPYTPWNVSNILLNVSEGNAQALIKEPMAKAAEANLKVYDKSGGEIPDMTLPLGYETELLAVMKPADPADYNFTSQTIKVNGSIAEAGSQAQTTYSEEYGGQIARLTITPTGTGTNAIDVNWVETGLTLARLNVSEAVNKLKINYEPQKVKPDEKVTLTITDTFEGELISDARVTITGPGGTANLVTDANGTVTFTPDEAGDYNIEVRRAGYGPATDVLSVEAVAEFSYNVSVSPTTVTYGEQYDVTVTVTNTGGAQGSVNVPVEINGQYITTRTVLVEAGSQRSFQLTRTADKVGANTVSVQDGQATAQFTVEKQTTTEALVITGPTTATVGETITLTVTADGSPVQADVTLDGTTKTTDTSGQVTFTVGEVGNLTFTATKAETETATTVKTYTQDTHTVEVSKQEVTKQLNIVGPTELTAGESATYLVKADGKVVEDATVEYNGQTLTTDSTGRVEITYTTPGNYLLTATMNSKETNEKVITYTSDSISVSVNKQPKQEVTKNLQLSIQTPTEDRQVGNKITIKVTADGEAVKDATVTVAGNSKTTSSDGTVSFTFEKAGTKIISASKGTVETADKITTYQSTSTSIDIQKTPGFTTALAIAAVLGAAFLIYRRRKQ